MRVAIVGAGLLGLTTAYFLRRLGADVCVIDKQHGPGLETSFANGGMLHASQANPWNEPGIFWRALKMLGQEDSALLIRFGAVPGMLSWLYQFIRQSGRRRYAENLEKNARLAAFSLRTLRELRREESLEYGCTERGTLKIFRHQAQYDAAAAMSDYFSNGGIAHQMLDRQAVIETEPALSSIADDIFGGILFPQDESGDAYKFCLELKNICHKLGVEFKFNTEVTGFRHGANQLNALVTNEGELDADAYVLATASYTTPLLSQLGLKLPVKPAKGYSITVPTDTWPGPPRLPVIDEQMHAALCPLGKKMRVAGTAEFAGFDLNLNERRIDNLFRLLKRVYPQFEAHIDSGGAERWCALRPMSSDGVGIMGKTPIDKLFLNTGHGHLGWTMAAGAGRMVAAEVLNQALDLDLAPYRLARFD